MNEREVNLTAAAAWLLMLRADADLGSVYRGALGMWVEMLNLPDDATALAYAEHIVAARPVETIAYLPPI